MTNLNANVALVTRSARGIGKAIAERFGRLGASVVINYSASERLGGIATAVQAEVSKVGDGAPLNETRNRPCNP
jgi:3-oxoacyl-[acyl-carrier protein] reductase